MAGTEATPQARRRDVIEDKRFTRRLYTVSGAARLVGMSPSTLRTWSHGYEKTFTDRPRVKQVPVITAIENGSSDRRAIPFIGLVEATVVQAFRRTGLPMQRIRKALEVLASQGELEHALASRQLFSDGASVLYDYARRNQDKQLRLLTVVQTGQRVFHEVIGDYLERITFGDEWATELILPVTERRLLRVLPGVAGGDALFMEGGAPAVGREIACSCARAHRVHRSRLRDARRGHKGSPPCHLADEGRGPTHRRQSSSLTEAWAVVWLPKRDSLDLRWPKPSDERRNP